MPGKDTTPDTLTKVAMRSEYLDRETEHELAIAWRDRRDEKALHRLVSAHMRLAISMASKFSRYGGSRNDLIQEANLGLLKAADKFDPERGVRFSTYAVWWIKASIQDYVMRDWSLVRTGSTTSQKALFFNLRRVQRQLELAQAESGERLDGHQLRERIAAEIGVSVQDVEMMHGRLAGQDLSLNRPQGSDEEGREWLDVLEDPSAQHSEHVEQRHDTERLRQWLLAAMNDLTERERFIVRERKLSSPPRTLASLGEELGLSKERIRQIENGALDRLGQVLERKAPEARALIA
ncbi:RNA polymerase factor sigma-32 [Aliiruegeria lutimaris]|uniref:RNA polymerase, sigma 32 subunit, RpoH n=1 Tax=Aliiruegeria lutimaris TaxID=571298 RepID=A0A1G9EZK8_9RHOB|nr:RNA polymerase factor sigma-32 [Aliiruegeria lutimaris]SDK81564.1 RNA polymerase, sigma 32 subunit, RpoH [Aliiruegeria lutimaris]